MRMRMLPRNVFRVEPDPLTMRRCRYARGVIVAGSMMLPAYQLSESNEPVTVGFFCACTVEYPYEEEIPQLLENVPSERVTPCVDTEKL